MPRAEFTARSEYEAYGQILRKLGGSPSDAREGPCRSRTHPTKGRKAFGNPHSTVTLLARLRG
jgi:hypothetical protein